MRSWMQIVIVGNDPALSLVLKRGLEADAHEVQCLRADADVLTACEASKADLLVIDADPLGDPALVQTDPACGGANRMLTALRRTGATIPVLVLTPTPNLEQRIHLLNMGADDCMAKPLSIQELRARCRALLRRPPGCGSVVRCEGVELDRVSHTVQRDGSNVVLTRKEFAVLEFLMVHRGECISRDALLAELWKRQPPAIDAGGTNVVDVYINYLRKKLGKTRTGGPEPRLRYECGKPGRASLIQTVRGVGYRVGAPGPGDRGTRPERQWPGAANG